MDICHTVIICSTFRPGLILPPIQGFTFCQGVRDAEVAGLRTVDFRFLFWVVERKLCGIATVQSFMRRWNKTRGLSRTICGLKHKGAHCSDSLASFRVLSTVSVGPAGPLAWKRILAARGYSTSN